MVTVVPNRMRVAAPSGEGTTKNFIILGIDGPTTLRAYVEGGGSLISLNYFSASRKVFVPTTTNWGDNEPPLHGGSSHPAEPSGYYDYVVVSAGEGEPLAVDAGLDIAGDILFKANAGDIRSVRAAKLVIVRDGGSRTEVPIDFMIGTIKVEPPASIEATIGQSILFPVRITIFGGSDCVLTLGTEGQNCVVPWQSVQVPSNGSVTANLTLYVRRLMNEGLVSENLWVKGFSDSQLVIPFQLKLKNPPPPETYDQYLDRARAAITQHYYANGAQRTFGFPLREFEVRDSIPLQHFARGPIKFHHGDIDGPDLNWVTCRFVGFEALDESTEWSGSDEPYFIIAAACSGKSVTVMHGPADDVDKGEIRVVNLDIVTDAQKFWPPLVLGAVAIEHDEGTPEEAERKVREVVEKLVNTVSTVAGGIAGADVGTYIMPEWARIIVLGWIPEIVGALFGLGDDKIGENSLVLWDHIPKEGNSWKQMPQRGMLDQNKYNVELTIPPGSADSEGRHRLYFDVKLYANGHLVGPDGFSLSDDNS